MVGDNEMLGDGETGEALEKFSGFRAMRALRLIKLVRLLRGVARLRRKHAACLCDDGL